MTAGVLLPSLPPASAHRIAALIGSSPCSLGDFHESTRGPGEEGGGVEDRAALRRGARRSVVVHLREEIAPALRRHVEETPERVDQIARAVVLIRRRRSKGHL